ncbi:MAG: Carboxypeptidase regulatory-like domain [Geminicoccaceae bacterium]|nr:Carboxypeptidase regulatory-like domain [Geminicoccaceae bacterium]
MRLSFSRPLGLLVAAGVAVAAGCRRAAPSPAGWAEANATADVAFVVGEVGSSRRGRPLESARVLLLDSTGAPRDSASTDATGAFLLGPLPPGAYRLQARAILHRPLTRPLTLRAGAVDTVRLRLTYADAGAIIDCVGPERPDGSRGFGSQFCRP